MLADCVFSYGQRIEEKDTLINFLDYWGKIGNFIKPDSLKKYDKWEKKRLIRERYISRDNLLYGITIVRLKYGINR